MLPLTNNTPALAGSISLEAVAPEHGIYRFFNISIGHNLFGALYITFYSGRMGVRGRQQERLFQNENECLKKLRQVLRKRLSARHRIGVNYCIVATTFERTWIEALIQRAPLKRTA